jgi:signal transduction histidine kinase
MVPKKKPDDPTQEQSAPDTESDQFDGQTEPHRPQSGVAPKCPASTEIGEQPLALSDADKLTMLVNAAVSLCHDIKTPVTYTQGSLDMHKRKLGETALSEQKPHLEVMDEGLRTINALIQQFSEEIDRIHPSKKYIPEKELEITEIEINNVLEVTIQYMENICHIEAADTVFETDITPDVTIMGHIGDIKRILNNFFQNAFDAMAEAPERENRLIVRLFTDEHYAYISICDNGVGLKTDDPQEPFNMAYTTKAEGDGVGLSHSFKRAKRMKGQITLEKNIGKPGTTVTLQLPLAKQKTSST